MSSSPKACHQFHELEKRARSPKLVASTDIVFLSACACLLIISVTDADHLNQPCEEVAAERKVLA